MQLLFALPNYQPIKEAIRFECILGDTVSKLIELENNSNKTITYFVKYEGSSDFVLEDQNVIKIEGKSSYKYKVKLKSQIQFVSRISSEQTGRIWFTSKKDGNT